MRRNPLDIYDRYPEDMLSYLQNYGWHFGKKACNYAVSLMTRRNPSTGRTEKHEPMSREQVDDLMKRTGVSLDNNTAYDYVYVANMAKADCWKSSLEDEMHLAKYVKDKVDDVDAGDGAIMRMWYASMVAKGEPVAWDEML